MTLSKNSKFLYNLNSGDHTITGFRINVIDGSLTPVTAVGGLPAGVNSLAAH